MRRTVDADVGDSVSIEVAGAGEAGQSGDEEEDEGGGGHRAAGRLITPTTDKPKWGKSTCVHSVSSSGGRACSQWLPLGVRRSRMMRFSISRPGFCW